jgi:hypothetical protein
MQPLGLHLIYCRTVEGLSFNVLRVFRLFKFQSRRFHKFVALLILDTMGVAQKRLGPLLTEHLHQLPFIKCSLGFLQL